METHELKLSSQYFNSVADGSKPFEVRFDDRDYKEGDILILKEWDSMIEYTGKEITKEISYIFDSKANNTLYGLEEGYCILGLKDIRKVKCCNVACKHNSAKCIKKDTGNIDCDDYGYCNFGGEINLIPFECSECGDLDEGIECENFEFKPQLQKGED